jgi:quinol-cytochrome oxidoreductase complex cytochrome b subunit
MGTKRQQSYTSKVDIEVKGKRDVHPVWRGVGLLMIVLIPVLGYIGALLVINSNKTNPWLTVPRALIVPGPDPLLLVKVILTIIIGAFVYFILMLLTFIIFRIFAPSSRGPFDVPPVHWKTKDKE